MDENALRKKRLQTAHSNLQAVEDEFDSLTKRRLAKETRLRVEQLLQDE